MAGPGVIRQRGELRIDVLVGPGTYVDLGVFSDSGVVNILT